MFFQNPNLLSKNMLGLWTHCIVSYDCVAKFNHQCPLSITAEWPKMSGKNKMHLLGSAHELDVFRLNFVRHSFEWNPYGGVSCFYT